VSASEIIAPPMRLLRLPGVFRPPSDTWMLAADLRAEVASGRRRVLDLCTGSGALALVAAEEGAEVTAIDVSLRSVATVRLNAALRRLRVRALRGDLFEPVAGREFDLIVSNPPYVPGVMAELPERGAARAWEAGPDGRVFIDRICAEAHRHLAPGGAIVIVQSDICGTEETLARLGEGGLEASVRARHAGPLGPLMSERVDELERRGLLEPGRRREEVVVIRGERPRG
jgi:release factor glutamine methyltransferase